MFLVFRCKGDTASLQICTTAISVLRTYQQKLRKYYFGHLLHDLILMTTEQNITNSDFCDRSKGNKRKITKQDLKRKSGEVQTLNNVG